MNEALILEKLDQLSAEVQSLKSDVLQDIRKDLEPVLKEAVPSLSSVLEDIDDRYTEGADKARRYAFHPNPRTPILKNKLGDSAGVYGAAWIGI